MVIPEINQTDILIQWVVAIHELDEHFRVGLLLHRIALLEEPLDFKVIFRGRLPYVLSPCELILLRDCCVWRISD